MVVLVIHTPTEIAGQMGMLAQGLRRLGITVAAFNWFWSYLAYRDHIVNTDAFELNNMVEYLARNTDLFHFHNADTMLEEQHDLPWLKDMGKKLIMHHWGNDVRTVGMVQQHNPYPLPPSYLSDEQIHHRLTRLSRYIDTAIVQDYEVYPYVAPYYRTVHVLPLACDVSRFPPAYPVVQNTVPRVLHAPTNRAFKGTAYVEEALGRLESQATFDYVRVERVSHDQALRIYASGDIVVDQLLCGSYGMLSVEAMALGKVVVAFIREDVREHLPADLPIVIARPETLADVLLPLLRDGDLRHELGRRSRAYVEQYHSLDHVAPRLLAIYDTL